MERVIVTGATSMIGEALIEECLKHGISVCAVIRKKRSSAARSSSGTGGMQSGRTGSTAGKSDGIF